MQIIRLNLTPELIFVAKLVANEKGCQKKTDKLKINLISKN